MLTPSELDLLKETYKLKAYYIGHDSDFYEDSCGEVVFAKSEEEAKQQAWRLDVGCYSSEDITRVDRQPHFDKFADLGYVPASELYTAGWEFECWGCNRRINSWSEDDEDPNYYTYDEEDKDGIYPVGSFNPQFEGKERVFCSPSCQQEWHQKLDNLKLLKTKVQQELEAKYPGCTVKYTGGNYGDQTVYFDLTIPGLKYKITYDSKHPDTVGVSNCDVPLWREFRDNK